MGTLRKLKNIVNDTVDYATKVRDTVNETDSKRKGHEFESYVAKNLFNRDYFEIFNWTHDLDHKHDGVRVESDKEPDLKICYRPTREEFSVECKWRRTLSPDNKLDWASEYSLRKYQRYAEQYPVFVVIGLGGEPGSPERMFCIPLSEARWPSLYPSVYTRFERPPRRQLFWKYKTLS